MPQWNKRGPKDRRRCFAEVTPRNGMWLVAIQKPIEVVMHAIFLWCAQQLNWDTIGKWATLSHKQVWKLTKACRLVAANFMMQNPDANKIGGLDKNGKPITVQVDETFCGKLKYHRGARKIQTWVLGGVEMPPENEPNRTPKFFALTVPNRKKETLIPTLKEKSSQTL